MHLSHSHFPYLRQLRQATLVFLAGVFGLAGNLAPAMVTAASFEVHTLLHYRANNDNDAGSSLPGLVLGLETGEEVEECDLSDDSSDGNGAEACIAASDARRPKRDLQGIAKSADIAAIWSRHGLPGQREPYFLLHGAFLI